MGWFGYGLYDGDETASRVYAFLELVGLGKYIDYTNNKDIPVNYFTQFPPIKLLPEHKNIIVKAYNKIIKKIKLKAPKNEIDKEYWSIDWQMLTDLIISNKMPITKMMKKIALEANEYLIGQHANDFDEPRKRRYHLKRFEKRLKKYRTK